VRQVGIKAAFVDMETKFVGGSQARRAGQAIGVAAARTLARPQATAPRSSAT